MPIKRLTAIAALFSVLLLSGPLHAANNPPDSATPVDSPVIANVASQLLQQLPVFNPAPMLGQSIIPGNVDALLADSTSGNRSTAVDSTAAVQTGGGQADAAGTRNITDLRKALLAAAMSLRDIRYVRGGHDPSTGFDCSGFVRYVFSHAIGMQLPSNSAAQFLAGLKVKRADMKPGDLVFFHTHGRRRISHVGIYISNGRFIHSPTTGKSVEISSLDSGYWAKRFAGAKRPEAMALVVNKG
ncbi:C40 family peptidase [Rhodanobacter ginsengisoli]|uniref:C40 family peptidase n=1 Tax=Rhodanobacter ginsengisoli TaxID=418646 RepID=A0ABW0QQ09_9GAMM